MSPTPARPFALAAALALALLLLLGAPAAHAASSTADEADVAFELGNEAYAKGNFNLALQAYFTSYRLVPNRSVLFNVARCYEALERYAEAYRYYDELAQVTEGLDPADVTEVRRSLERLRPQVALVRVDSTPRGADVFVNRVDEGSRGRTPLTLALPPGARARLLLRKEGYRAAEASVTPVKGRQQAQLLELAPITGTVELTGSPAGAEVREGSATGPVLGKLPGPLSLAPGRHLLHVSAPGHASAELTVEVPADGSVAAQVALNPGPEPGPTGRVRVTASREGARVRVDGQPAGTTPALLTLGEGVHTLEVESNEVRPVSQQVQVEREREVVVHVPLRYAPPPVSAATRALQPVAPDEVAPSTLVLSQEELRAFGYATLAEALAGVRGFFLSDDRRYTTAGLRGVGAGGDAGSRVLVLWDGHPLRDAWAGGSDVGRELSADLDEVERIEVVRGPMSALYGSGAMLGVINVVPRGSLGVGQHLEVTGALGALGAARGHLTGSLERAGAGGAADSARSLLVSAAVGRVRGAEFTAPAPGLPPVEGLDAERAAGGSVRARLGHLTLFGQLDARRKEVPTAPRGTLAGAAGTEARDVRGFVEARYARALAERVQLELRGSYDANRYRGRWAFAPGAGGERTEAASADWLGGEARLSLQLGAAQRLTLGVEAQGQLRLSQEQLAPAGDAPRVGLPARTQLSASLSDDWQLHPRLLLSAGLRVDRFSDVEGTPLSPRVALLARPYATGLSRLSVARGFRAPGALELYGAEAGAGADPGAPPAPAPLSAEAVTTLELEHSHDLNEALRLTVGGHLSRYSDLLVPGGFGASTNAPGVTRAWGAEAGVHWQPARMLLVDLSYAWVHLEDEAGPLAALPAPRHLAVGRLLLPVGDGSVRLATQATYQSARGEESQGGAGAGEALLVGFGVSGDYGRLRYFAGVNNVLDVAYSLPLPGPIPQYRRTFTLQLTGSY